MEGGHAMVIARMKFEKGEEVRYISHLDLQRTFQRALRRAQIDTAYSQGFNPHSKISFAMALPVGMTSEGEYVDVELNHPTCAKKLMDQLNTSLPEGLKILDCKISQGNHPSLMSIIQKGLYWVKIYTQNFIDPDQIEKKIVDFLDQKEIKIQKKDKKGRVKGKNIRPFIDEISMEKVEEQFIYLKMKLSAGSQNNVKPEIVVERLTSFGQPPLEYNGVKIHRIDLLAQDGERFISPMELF